MDAKLAIEAPAPIENVALCFYVDGWNGPGLYECGFHRRQGQGWHGPRVGDGRRGRDVDGDRRGINLVGQAFTFKPRGGVGATEPPTNPHDWAPSGAFSLDGGRTREEGCLGLDFPWSSVQICTDGPWPLAP